MAWQKAQTAKFVKIISTKKRKFYSELCVFLFLTPGVGIIDDLPDRYMIIHHNYIAFNAASILLLRSYVKQVEIYMHTAHQIICKKTFILISNNYPPNRQVH